jgi:hypothetical protein
MPEQEKNQQDRSGQSSQTASQQSQPQNQSQQGQGLSQENRQDTRFEEGLRNPYQQDQPDAMQHEQPQVQQPPL